MEAVVESGGFQYKVSENSTIYVPKREAEVGEVLQLSRVLLISDQDGVLIGSPYLEGASVEGRVLSHGKRRKIIVYKYKSKKNYRRKRGHRQDFTELLITRITKPGEEPRPAEAEVKPIPAREEERAIAAPAAEEKAGRERPKRSRRLLRLRKAEKKEE